MYSKIKHQTLKSRLRFFFAQLKEQKGHNALILLFDIVFLIVAYYFITFSNWVVPDTLLASRTASAVLVVLILIIYYAVLLAIYSFFKMYVLDALIEQLHKTSISMRDFFAFFKLNVLHLFVFVVLAIIINLFILGIQQQFKRYFFLFVLIPFLLLYFTFLMVTHIHFVFTKKSILRKSLMHLAHYWKSYVKMWFVTIIGFIIVNIVGAGLLFMSEFLFGGIGQIHESGMLFFTVFFMYILFYWLRFSICLSVIEKIKAIP